MNDHDEVSELPELTDDTIRLLYHVCELAAQTKFPPFKALFTAYDHALEGEQGDHEQDAVVFRYLMRLGDSARRPFEGSAKIDLVEQLRNLLSAQGITLQDGDDDLTRTTAASLVRSQPGGKTNKRRVSFDHAGVEERWLNEHSQPLIEPSPGPRDQASPLVARNRRAHNSGRRAQSTGPQRHRRIKSLPKSSQRATIRQDYTNSDYSEAVNPTLLIEPSHNQLEQNAEAFLYTSDLRSARIILHIWHEAVVLLGRNRNHAYAVASSYDRKTLLKQAWDQWLVSLQETRDERWRQDELDRQGKRAFRERSTMLASKALRHWATEARHERDNVKWAQRHMLMVRYFWRWKSIAHENQMKARSILCRKYLAKMRDRLARRLLYQEQAEAIYEESLLKRCKRSWFWKLCERRVITWHDTWIIRRAFTQMTRSMDLTLQQKAQADNVLHHRVTRQCLSSLASKSLDHRRSLVIAGEERKWRNLLKAFSAIKIEARLAPIEREISSKLDDYRQRRAFEIWRNRAQLSRKATSFDNRRILLNAWTKWNDSLRFEALVQKQNERLLLETLYKWVLQERLCLFRRTSDDRLLAETFRQWSLRSGEVIDRLQWAERVFQEGQHKRRLGLSMFRLHVAKRKNEDAERAAVEFSNSRELPKSFRLWSSETERLRQTAKWAEDARFYFVSSSTLKVLKQKASEHSHQRRRAAYAQTRAMVKTRIVGDCFQKWSAENQRRVTMHTKASLKDQAKVEKSVVQAFKLWRTKTIEITDKNSTASAVDRRKLVNATFSAITRGQTNVAGMFDLARSFRHETDLISLAAALKKIQWSQFTAARRAESAEALWARNRDIHVRTMLRHWSDRASARRMQAGRIPQFSEEEIESPSIRPASRMALQDTMLLSANVPSTVEEPRTPGYLRTPSRSQRRAGRFRSLPTPAPFTPMGFDAAYFVTTPGPTSRSIVSGNALSHTEDHSDDNAAIEGLTPQITPFSRKLRAGGVTSARFPPSALRSSVLGQDGGTSKSVRFARLSRFRSSNLTSGGVIADELSS